MRALEPDDPRTVGGYRILARIGGGGMAVVYFGRSATGRPVAVKLVYAELAADPGYRARFRNEVAAARAAGGQYSPGVLGADADAEVPWLATEFLPAVSLHEAVRLAGPLPPAAVWPLAAGFAEALASLHRAGIVHLDLKPANLLLTADGPRVIDFGIAGWTRSATTAADRDPGGDRAGAGTGSRGYMPPEQESGGRTGPATDVFAFGATLAYACTGAPPADADPAGIGDRALRALVLRCLDRDPAARPTLSELTALPASPPAGSGPAGLPPAVMAEVERRAALAENPPSAPELAPPAPRRPDRRTLLYAVGAVGIGIAGAVVTPLLLARGPTPKEAAPDPSRPPVPTTPPSTAPAEPAATAQDRTLEFFLFGHTTLKSVTTTVNGHTVTLHDVKLPYRRVVVIPRSPQRSTWRIAYLIGKGEISWKVLVDDQEYGSGDSSSTNPDVKDHSDGVI